jgi:hypothetical protein
MKKTIIFKTIAFACCLMLIGLSVPHLSFGQLNRTSLLIQQFRPNSTANEANYRLSDGDVIMMTTEEGGGTSANNVQIMLKAEDNVRWWKGINLYVWNEQNAQYQISHFIYVQDDSKSAHFTIPVRLLGRVNARGNLPKCYLEFAKAKTFGEHTGMYHLFYPYLDLLPWVGKRIVFTWQRD